MKDISFLDHLIELRKRALEYAIVLFLLVVIGLAFSKKILFVFTRLIDMPLVTLSPAEGIITVLKVGFLAGFIVSLPLLVFQIWRYISYGLSKTQNQKLKLYLVFSLLLFLAGISLAYFVVIPLGLDFLVNYGTELFNPMFSISSYISFVTLLIFLFGVVFQLPLIILFLNGIGIVSKQQLKEKRRYFYLAAFIIGAFLTPPDVITQISLAIPIILLYEVSYFIVWLRKS